jgi:hypothetical protein
MTVKWLQISWDPHEHTVGTADVGHGTFLQSQSESRINDEETYVLYALISSWRFKCTSSEGWLAFGSSANVPLMSYYATSKLLSCRTFA